MDLGPSHEPPMGTGPEVTRMPTAALGGPGTL